MEVRCQALVPESPASEPCNAIIPRLERGVCVAPVPEGKCGTSRGAHDAGIIDDHAYLGPLASECEAGHVQPVEVV